MQGNIAETLDHELVLWLRYIESSMRLKKLIGKEGWKRGIIVNKKKKEKQIRQVRQANQKSAEEGNGSRSKKTIYSTIEGLGII